MAITDQQVKIEVTDKVASSVGSKFNSIAKSARAAGRAVQQLQDAVKQLNGSGLNALAAAMGKVASASSALNKAQESSAQNAAKVALANEKLATQMGKTSVEQQRLQTEYNRTVSTQNNATVASQRINTEMQRTSTESARTSLQLQKLATEYEKTATAANQSALAAQKVSTEYQRTIIATNNAALTAARVSTEQQRLATEEQRTAIAAQRLATEVERTAQAESNAAIAAIRLAQAEREAAAGAGTLNMSLGGVAATVGSLMGIGFGVSSIVKTADAYTVMENRLSTVSDSQAQTNKLMDEMFKLANETRTAVDVTTESFVRFDRALSYIGKSQEDTIRMVKTINEALTVSGTHTQEASSALLQLSQAFNAGKLQGDEFRSISENMPMLLVAVAAAANKEREDVKKMSSEGKIDIQLLYKAIEMMAGNVDELYKKLTPTVAEAMVVMNNSWTQYIGKMSKALQSNEVLGSAIFFVARHLDALGVAAAAAGGMLLVAFGPLLLSALAAATNAVLGFTAALATNPIGLIVVGITTATAAIVTYGDQIEVNKQQHITLKDYARAAFAEIGEAANEACQYVVDLWHFMTGETTKQTEKMAEDQVSVFDQIVSGFATGLKWSLNFIINLLKAVQTTIVGFIKATWQAFNIMGTATYNAGVTIANTLVDVWSWTVKQVAKVVGWFNAAAAESMNKAVDNIHVNLKKMDYSDVSSAWLDNIVHSWSSGLIDDTLGSMFGSWNSKAKAIAEKRRAAEEADKNAQLRGKGKDNSKKQAPKEKKSEAQKAYERDLKAIRQPQIDYNASIAAANTLLAKGEITQSRYNTLIERAKDVYATATDPLHKYNKETSNQLELYGQVGPKAEALQIIQQQRAQALSAGLPWEEKYNKEIEKNVQLLADAKTRHEVMNSIYEETIGKQNTLVQQQTAYNDAINKGTISFEQYQIATQKLNVEMANLKLKMGEGSFSDVMTASMGTVVSNYDGMMSGLTTSFGTFFQSFTDGFADSVGQAIIQGDSLSESLTNVARTGLQELISALVKLGIQYLINSTLATTSIATSTATSTAAAAATTAAWSPAAAAVSIATFGAAAAAGTASMLTSVGSITATMTALSQGGAIAGFKEGGYTGNYGRNEVAGVVHGQEHVLTAETTARIGTKKLDALNNGASLESVSQNSNATTNSTTNNFYLTTNNDIDMQGAQGDSDESTVNAIMKRASQLTQQQIADSINRGGPWATLIRNVAAK